MSKYGILYALFCLGVLYVSYTAVREGYAPFASGGGGRTPLLFGHVGPTHK